jgi:predicted DNA-binding transcriptional regulator YafY
MMPLEELMARVRKGGTLETGRLAAELNASVEMVESMLEHLQRQGVISEYIRCTDGCDGCGLQAGCSAAPQMRLWRAGGVEH